MSGGDFWSRRRAAVEAEESAEQAAEVTAEAAVREAELEALSDEEILAERNLPDPDTLESPEDVRAFLAEALPQRLKTRALRRLWRLNPVLANLDGLVDYGEDFTNSATVIENMQTAYQVGKGMLRHIEAKAEAEAEALAAKDEVIDDGGIEVTDGEDAIALAQADEAEPLNTVRLPEPVAEAEAAPVWVETAEADYPEAQDDDIPAPIDPTRRRMRFQFEGQT